MNTTPRRIEWAGPEGWSVWADEDGVHLRSTKGDSLEMPDVKRLFDLWSEACAAVSPGGQIAAPKPPTREEMRAWSAERTDAHIMRRAQRAIESEFAPVNAPF